MVRPPGEVATIVKRGGRSRRGDADRGEVRRSSDSCRYLERPLRLPPAQAARRFNPALKAFADRLAAAGKKPKVVLTAVARKLLTIADAIIRSGRPWDENPAKSRPTA
jgi:transposase